MRGLACIAILCASPAFAADLPESALDVHGQATYIRQYKPSFPAAYSGPHSLDAERAWSYTLTGTLFFGARLGDATELYFNPEFVQGFAFSQLQGTGGFTNGEIQRTTGQQLRGYRARLFARHTWNLGGEIEEKESDLNQVRTRYAAERFVLTAGNLSVLDVFDVLEYSHDPRTQFMNWVRGSWLYSSTSKTSNTERFPAVRTKRSAA